jgi:magnesium transporter
MTVSDAHRTTAGFRPVSEEGLPEPALRAAAAFATRRVPTAAPGETAGELRARLVGASFECADDVAVLIGETLVGMLPVERVLEAAAATEVRSIMDQHPPIVLPGEAQESVAWEMVRRGESSIAVVDDDGRFVGLVPPHRLVAALLAEHDEDLARLGGYLASTRRARQAAEEPVARRLWHRLPWLLIGLFGAMISATIVGAYESELDAKVLLAFFVPGIVYMADAVGTQTEAILIRGLSSGLTVRSFVQREVITGAIVGVVIGGCFFVFALVVWGDASVAIAVGLALVACCSIATLVAMSLPWLLQRLGLDPAFGSGPLATVIQDLLSIAVYLAIATSIAT